MQGALVKPVTDTEEPRGTHRLQAGLQAFEQCRWLDAIESFREVLAEGPKQPDLVGKLAFALSQARKYDEAVEVLMRLCEDEPRLAKWPYMVGYQFYMWGDWKRAIEWFDKALALNGAYVKALYRKGYAHFQLGQHDDSVKALLACIESWQRLSPELQQADNKTYEKANFLLGKAYLGRGLSLKARQPLQIAVKMDGDNPDRRYELGKCLLQNSDVQGAIRELDRANSLRPGTDYVIDRLAQAYVQRGDLQRAEALYREIPRHRQRPFVLKNLGKLYLEQGRAEDALAVLQVAARKDQANHNTQFLLGKALESTGRHQAAVQAYQAAVTLKHQNYGIDFIDAQEALQRLKDATPKPDADLQPEVQLGPDQHVGLIVQYNAARGFGFISSTGQRVFFHITGVVEGYAPVEGGAVRFHLEQSEKGPRAVRVEPVRLSAERTEEKPFPRGDEQVPKEESGEAK
jgi:tetratricopeptide (TPR) repeat protein